MSFESVIGKKFGSIEAQMLKRAGSMVTLRIQAGSEAIEHSFTADQFMKLAGESSQSAGKTVVKKAASDVAKKGGKAVAGDVVKTTKKVTSEVVKKSTKTTSTTVKHAADEASHKAEANGSKAAKGATHAAKPVVPAKPVTPAKPLPIAPANAADAVVVTSQAGRVFKALGVNKADQKAAFQLANEARLDALKAGKTAAQADAAASGAFKTLIPKASKEQLQQLVKGLQPAEQAKMQRILAAFKKERASHTHGTPAKPTPAKPAPAPSAPKNDHPAGGAIAKKVEPAAKSTHHTAKAAAAKSTKAAKEPKASMIPDRGGANVGSTVTEGFFGEISDKIHEFLAGLKKFLGL